MRNRLALFAYSLWLIAYGFLLPYESSPIGDLAEI
jgi:hypothetical protein